MWLVSDISNGEKHVQWYDMIQLLDDVEMMTTTTDLGRRPCDHWETQCRRRWRDQDWDDQCRQQCSPTPPDTPPCTCELSTWHTHTHTHTCDRQTDRQVHTPTDTPPCTCEPSTYNIDGLIEVQNQVILEMVFPSNLLTSTEKTNPPKTNTKYNQKA